MFLKLRISNHIFYQKSTCDNARDVDIHICVSVCVHACDLLELFNNLRGHTANIFPEKVSHVPTDPDSCYFISKDRKKYLRSQANLENC